jgi:outer membrane receptor protein involved in Fe transport
VEAGVENQTNEFYADHLGGINRVTGSDVPVNQHLPGAGRFGYFAARFKF